MRVPVRGPRTATASRPTAVKRRPTTIRGNCGACGKSCGPNQECSAGVCMCDTGFGDCNMMPDDGCEADFSRPETCGTCSNDCGANTTCTGAACGCRAGFLNCDASPGCEAQASSPQSCGSCGTRLQRGNTGLQRRQLASPAAPPGRRFAAASRASTCRPIRPIAERAGARWAANQLCAAGVPTCAPGFANCNGIATDGCEIDLGSDPAHCGSCPNCLQTGRDLRGLGVRVRGQHAQRLRHELPAVLQRHRLQRRRPLHGGQLRRRRDLRLLRGVRGRRALLRAARLFRVLRRRRLQRRQGLQHQPLRAAHLHAAADPVRHDVYQSHSRPAELRRLQQRLRSGTDLQHRPVHAEVGADRGSASAVRRA